MIQQKNVAGVAGIKKLIFWIAGIIALIAIIIVWKTNSSETEKHTIQPIRMACPAGMENSSAVKTPGNNRQSQKVSIPLQCDFRVFTDATKKVHMITFPDGEIHSPGPVIKRVHKNNPEAIAFFSVEPADVTVILFPFGTLPR